MKNVLVSSVVLGMFLSSQAFAWRGNGHRPQGEAKLPVLVAEALAASSDDILVVKVLISNRLSSTDKLCDTLARITTQKGTDVVEITAFSDKMMLKHARDYEYPVAYAHSEAPTGYSFLKTSQVVESACVELDPGDVIAQVPAPSDLCNPEYQDCDWTCQASQKNSGRCASPTQDWSNNPNQFIIEE